MEKMEKLFMLYAILIFAKRAPKLIAELLKIKGEGVGLKGLNIKNKMGEAVLVGDRVKQGMTKAEGGIKGAVGGALGGSTSGGFASFKQGFKGNNLKEKLKSGFSKDNLARGGKGFAKGLRKGLVTGGVAGVAAGAASKDGKLKGIMTKNYKQAGQVARGGGDSLLQRGKNRIASVGEKITAKGFGSLAIARSNEAEKHKNEIRGMYGSKNGSDLVKALANKGYTNSKGEKVYGEDVFNDSDAFAAFKKDLKGIRGATNAEDIAKALYNGDWSKLDSASKTARIEDARRKYIVNDSGQLQADGLSLMENIHKERAKHLGNIQEFYQRYENATDAQTKEELKKQLINEIQSNQRLFSENAGSGANLGIAGFDVSKYNLNTDVGKQAALNWAATEAYTDSKKNDKALSDVQKDIQSRNAVEAESGKKKEG